MKLLFIHEVNYLTKPIFEMHELPEYLASVGHEVYFLHFPEGVPLSDRQWTTLQAKIPGRVFPNERINLITPRLITSGILGRLFVAIQAPWLVRRIIREVKPDLILSYAVPTYGWQALVVARANRIPFVYRALDLPHLIRKSVFKDAIRLAEKFILRNSNWVTVNNAALKEHVVALGSEEKYTSVDWPPLDTERFFPKRKSTSLIRSLNLEPHSRVIMYMGSFFYFSGLERALKVFLESDSDAKFLLIGGGELEGQLRDIVQQYDGASRVVFVGYVQFSSLPDYLRLSDVAINPMVSMAASNYALPNKILQYLACGVEVVTTDLLGARLTLGRIPSLHFVDSPEEVMRKAISIVRRKEGSQYVVRGTIPEEMRYGVALPSLEERITGVAEKVV